VTDSSADAAGANIIKDIAIANAHFIDIPPPKLFEFLHDKITLFGSIVTLT
jgi:hypothetical protein